MNIIEIQKKILPKIRELLQVEPEIISSIEKTEKGLIVQCEVLEKKSVPETFDLLKVFEFEIDSNGRILGYKQIKKIRRGDLE